MCLIFGHGHGRGNGETEGVAFFGTLIYIKSMQNLLSLTRIHYPIINLQFPNVINNEKLSKIGSVASYVLGKFAKAFVINIAIRLAFSAFFMPQAAVIKNVVMLAFTAYIVAKIAQHFFRQSEMPPFLKSIAHSALVTSLTFKLNNYIHEYGHAFAARMSYVDAQPEVFVNYSEGGTNYVISNGFTRFGKYMGEQRTALFVTAAGLMSPIFCTIAEFAVAHGMQGAYPDLSEILIDHGFSQLAHAAYYGISSFFVSETQLENDFIKLWQVGDIHPLLPITLMLAIPLAEICIFKYLEQAKEVNGPT